MSHDHEPCLIALLNGLKSPKVIPGSVVGNTYDTDCRTLPVTNQIPQLILDHGIEERLVFVIETLQTSRTVKDSQRSLIQELIVPVLAVMVARHHVSRARVTLMNSSYSLDKSVGVPRGRFDVEEVPAVDDRNRSDVPSVFPHLT
jgi:hypothetical protein